MRDFYGPIEDETALVQFQEKWLKTYFEVIGVPSVSLRDRLWYSTGSRIFINLPCDGPITIDDEQKRVLWNSGAVFLKYPSAVEFPGFPSYLYLVTDKSYDLETLSSHVRKETARALKKCHVEQIPIKDILSEAPSIIADTHIRQGREFDNSILLEWMDAIRAASENPLFECWASFVGSRVGAFRIDFTYRGGFYGDVLFNVKELLKYQVMNALMFVSTRDVIRRPHVDHVSYGMRSIYGDKPSLNKFKESMGYRKIVFRERIEVAPWFRILINRKSAGFGAMILEKIGTRSQKFQKLEAILDMYSSQFEA